MLLHKADYKSMDLPCTRVDGKYQIYMYKGTVTVVGTGEEIEYWCFDPKDGENFIVLCTPRIAELVGIYPPPEPNVDALQALLIHAEKDVTVNEDTRYVLITEERWNLFNEKYIELLYPIPRKFVKVEEVK